MKVLLVGGGGREHAIAWKLSQSPRVTELLCAPGNAGIAQIARCFAQVKATDIEGILALVRQEAVDFVVVAPDDPLALGLVDRLEEMRVPAFGPKAGAARIEASKAFSKALMKKYDIPTAAYETFIDYEAACAYIDTLCAEEPIVVKADGLALGKGVIIAQNRQEAKDAVRAMMIDGQFQQSGSTVVIEEFMRGREVTQLVFTDGTHYVLMPSSQDHKRALDHDQGLNTGGMGAFAPSPYFTQPQIDETCRRIIEPTLAAMRAEGIPFKGVLYFGLMMTQQGVKVVEYNARFGDPETQVVLPLLKSDLMEIFLACANGTLEACPVEWEDKTCACVVLASGGYPETYTTGYSISGLAQVPPLGGTVFHAGTKQSGDEVLTAGGRVLAVSAIGKDLAEAVDAAYNALRPISFEKMHLRSDIGRR